MTENGETTGGKPDIFDEIAAFRAQQQQAEYTAQAQRDARISGFLNESFTNPGPEGSRTYTPGRIRRDDLRSPQKPLSEAKANAQAAAQRHLNPNQHPTDVSGPHVK
jgi:hypothetical protein